MTVKEYLLNDPPIKLAHIAKIMYPENNYANTALNSKLKGVQGRSFNSEDAKLAKDAIEKITKQASSLTID